MGGGNHLGSRSSGLGVPEGKLVRGLVQVKVLAYEVFDEGDQAVQVLLDG